MSYRESRVLSMLASAGSVILSVCPLLGVKPRLVAAISETHKS